MAYLIFLIVLVLLFAGFLTLTAYEGRRGRRYFAGVRTSFDQRVARLEFIATHVDFAAFIRDTAKEVGERAAHDIAHVVLQAVRWAERQLTRTVRALRERRAEVAASNGNGNGNGNGANAAPAAPQQASEFARGMTDFKQELRAQRDDQPSGSSAEEPTSTVE